MELKKLKQKLVELNNKRPFSAYIHGTTNFDFVNELVNDKKEQSHSQKDPYFIVWIF